MTSLRDANPVLAAHFPNLTDDNNSVESPRSRRYNCIAWACEIDTLRYWPSNPDMDWPDGLADIGDGLDAFEALFVSMGYEHCDSADLEPGMEKIAIYADDDGPTHAARQVVSGRWASKMGYMFTEDIEHDTLDDVAGNGYGRPEILMRRPRAS